MRIIFILFFCLQITTGISQKYKVYSEAGSYGMGSRAIYEREPQKKLTEFIYSKVDIVMDKYFIVTEQGGSTAQLLSVDLKVIIPQGKYSKISVSDDNLNFARVCSGGKYGIFDIKLGKIVVPCKYNYLGDLNKNGITPYNKGGVDMMPQLVQGGKWGYVTVAGLELMPPTYTWCSNLNETDFGTAYIGGNSSDGLYGGYWTLINSSGKILIDDAKYYVRDKDPYNEPPEKYVQLYKKAGNTTTSIFVTCDGKTLKEYKYEVGTIYSDGLMEVSQRSGKDYDEERLYGVTDMNENIIIPLKYASIRKFANTFLMTLQNKDVEYYDNKTKTIKSLGIKDFSELSYHEKENKEENHTLWHQAKYPWLIYGKDQKNKWQFYNSEFQIVLSDVDSLDRNNNWASVGFEKQSGSYFKYYKNGFINFFTAANNSKLNRDFSDVQEYFETYCWYERGKTDSVFVKKDGKWGQVSTKNYEGNNFVFDKIEIINQKHIVAVKNGKNYLFNDGERAYDFPPLDKIITSSSSSYRIPRKSGTYYPHTHLIVERNKKRYLVDIKDGQSWGNSFKSCLVDSGNIERIELDMYIKNGLPYLLWTQKQLPKGTTRCYDLDDWTAKSDINIYAFKVGALYGIMDENGKILEQPHYPQTDHVSIYPPEGFDYKEKKK